jgi:hypothetical protein
LKVNTIKYQWELELFEEEVSMKNITSYNFYPIKTKKEIIKVNKSIQYINYNIFESIYALYCDELFIKKKYAYNIFNFLLSNKKYYIDYIDGHVVIPKVFYINQIAFEVEYLTKKEFKKLMKTKYAGFIVPAAYKIFIDNSSVSTHCKFHTILHECIHGIFYTLGDQKKYNNEKYVESVTCILLHFMKNNKDLLRLLLLADSSDIITCIENDSHELK